MEDIIPENNSVSPNTLKGSEQIMLDPMNPLCFVLPCYLEELVSQIGLDDSVEV